MHFFTLKTIFLTFALLLFSLVLLQAQVTVVDNTAGGLPDISKCSGFGTESLTVVFPSASGGSATLSLTLPAGVSYVCGSVSPNGGAAITDAATCDAMAPVFDITGLGGAGSNVQFSFDLTANCSSTDGSKTILIDVAGAGGNDCTSCGSGALFEIQEAS